MISKKTLIACVCIIAVLVGGFLFLTFGGQDDTETDNQTKPETTQTVNEPIFTADIDSITAYSVINNNESYEIYLKDGTWVVKGYEQILFNQASIKSTLYNYVSLVPSLIVDDSSEDAASYGFDKPLGTVVITTSDGAETTFYLGDKTKGGNGYYLMMEGDDSIYTVSTVIGNSITKTLMDYRDTAVISVTPEEITEINMTVQGTGEVSVKRLETQKDVMTSWTMTKPFEIGVYDDKFTEAVLTPLTSVSVVEFISDDPTVQQLEDSGITNPELYYEVKTADNSYRVDIGKSFDGYFIAKRSDLPSVYLLNPDELSFLFTDIIDYISSYAYLPEHSEVTAISSSADGVDYDIVNSDTISINENIISQESYSEFYQKFFGIRLRGRVTTDPETTEPDFSYSVTKSDGSVDNISFVKMNSRYMYMFVNGKTEFYVYTEDVNNAMKSLAEALDNAVNNDYEDEEEPEENTDNPGGFKWLGLLVVIIVIALIIVFPISMLKNSNSKK